MATLINSIASAIIAISITGFIAMLEADNNPVQRMARVIRLWIKVSLAMIAAGSLMNVLVQSTPIWSEIVMNSGLAGLFSWAYWWHRSQWVKVGK